MDIEKYSELAPQYYSDEIPPLLKKYLENNSYNNILDCGCGDGSLLYSLDKRGYFKNKTVYALDLSKKRIDLVKKINPSIIARVDNAERLDEIKNYSIDIYIATQVIEHVNDKEMIANIIRTVKKNGIIYISTVFKKWYGWYFYRQNGKWLLDPTHLREYTSEKQLLRLFDQNIFEILESKKTLQRFPVIDFIIKMMRIKNRRIYAKKLFKTVRLIKIPVLGYYNWEIILKKR